jgi:hypothetical protein
MTDENGGFFSNAENNDSSDYGYSYNEPAPATESDPQLQQPQENTQQQPAVNQPNQDFETLRQQLEQERQRNERFEQDWNRFKEVFHPEQKQPDPNQQALVEWEQKISNQATSAAIQQFQYEMAEREALQKYPHLAGVEDLVRSPKNVEIGFAQFQQKYGRTPSTPIEQVQAAVDAYISRTGYSGQTQQPQQASNTIPLNLRSHNPSKEFDPSTASTEDFHKFVQAKLAKQYQ